MQNNINTSNILKLIGLRRNNAHKYYCDLVCFLLYRHTPIQQLSGLHGDTSMCSLLTTRRSCRYISVIFKLLFPTVNLTPLNHCLTGSPQAKTVLNFYMKLPHARVSDREFKASFFSFVKSTSMELTIKTKVRLSSYVEDKDFPITGLCGRTRNTMSNVTVSCCGCVCLCVCVCFEGWRSC